MRDLAEEFYREHSGGWVFVMKGVDVAVLSFLSIDYPCYVFRVQTLSQPDSWETPNAELLRGDDSRFVNRASGRVVPGLEMSVHFNENGTADIRDFRTEI